MTSIAWPYSLTYLPGVTLKDLCRIGQVLGRSKTYILQPNSPRYYELRPLASIVHVQLNGMSVGNYIVQAILSLYQQYELTCAGIMAIQERSNKIAKKQSLGKSVQDLSWKGIKSGEPAFIDKNNNSRGREGWDFQKTFWTRPLVSLMSEGQPMINVVLLNKGSTWGAPWGKHVNNFN